MDMTMRNEGASILWHNGTGADVGHGEVIKLGNRIGIAAVAIPAGDSGTVWVRGIFQGASVEGDAFSEGDILYWDPAARVLSKVPGLSASIAAGSNTGNGVAGDITLGDAAVAETFTLTCTAASENAGTFKVIGNVHGRMQDLTVGTAYDCGAFSFTLADGDIDFAEGDTFILTVAQANYKAGFAASIKETAGAVAEVEIG